MPSYPKHNIMVLVDMLSDKYSRDHKERILRAIKSLRDDDNAEALEIERGCIGYATATAKEPTQ